MGNNTTQFDINATRPATKMYGLFTEPVYNVICSPIFAEYEGFEVG